MPRYGWVGFLTDYGQADVFVGVCHGVLARLAPHARVIDLSHAVPAGNVRVGARMLAQAVPYLPPAVHVAVVDPGVGTARRPVAVLAGESVLVGPDNGLLPLAADALGGVTEAVELTAERYRLHPVSATFHGRDVFAPAAAHLAAGGAPADLGPAVPPADLVRLPGPQVRVTGTAVTGTVALVDGFGNVQTDVPAGTFSGLPARQGARATVVVAGGARDAVVGRTFGDAETGGLVVLVDSAGYVSVAVRDGDAATALGVQVGDAVKVQVEAGS